MYYNLNNLYICLWCSFLYCFTVTNFCSFLCALFPKTVSMNGTMNWQEINCQNSQKTIFNIGAITAKAWHLISKTGTKKHLQYWGHYSGGVSPFWAGNDIGTQGKNKHIFSFYKFSQLTNFLIKHIFTLYTFSNPTTLSSPTCFLISKLFPHHPNCFTPKNFHFLC